MNPEQKSDLERITEAAYAQRMAEEEVKRAERTTTHKRAIAEEWLNHSRRYLDGCRAHIGNRMSNAMQSGCSPTDIAKAVLQGAETADIDINPNRAA